MPDRNAGAPTYPKQGCVGTKGDGAERETRLRWGLGAQMFNGGHIRPLLNIFAPSPFVPEPPPPHLSRSFSGSPQALIFGQGSAHSPVKGRYPFPFGSAAFSKHAQHAMPVHDKTPARKAQGFLSHCHVMFRRRLTPERGRCKSAHRRRASCHPSRTFRQAPR